MLTHILVHGSTPGYMLAALSGLCGLKIKTSKNWEQGVRNKRRIEVERMEGRTDLNSFITPAIKENYRMST